MLSLRILAAAFVLSSAAAGFTACFSGPTTGGSRSSNAHASSAAAGGDGGSSGTGAATTAGNGGGASGAGGAGAGVGAGPSDGGFSDVSPDAIGKGGLPEGAQCGAFATSDASACGLGLACCPPCSQCDTVCALPCNPAMHGCVNGCLPKAGP